MIHRVEVQILLLLLVASVVGMLARRLRLPYTLALTLAGLTLGFVRVGVLEGVELRGDLLMLLLLPALLFEAAFHIDPRELRRQIVPVLTLAVAGVGVAVAATAGLAWLGLARTGLVEGFGWSHALIFAAVLAATDPISVLALFKELGVSRRLYLLVEGESLLNDGVAVVVFGVVGAVLGFGGVHGGAAAPEGALAVAGFAARTFCWMALVGIATGLVVGGAASFLTRFTDDHLIETTLTTLVAYGAFLAAEELHASGVLSTVTAGIVMGSYGRTVGMGVSTRVAVEDFWEYAAFLANSFVFLLVGLVLVPGELVRHAPAIAVGFAAVTVARALVIHGLLPIAARFSDPVPPAWRHVLVWGGLRGSLSMVLVISVPVTFPGRDVLVALVFGTVATSLFLQGLTMGPLLGRLGLRAGGETRAPYELARGRALAARHAVEQADALAARGALDPAAHRRLMAFYRARIERFDEDARLLGGEASARGQLVEGLRRLADAEHETVGEALRHGIIEAPTANRLAAEIDARLDALADAERSGDRALAERLDLLLAAPERAQPDVATR